MLQGLSPAQIGQVTAAFDQAFMYGFHVALFVAGAVLVVAAVVANRFIPGRDTEHVRAPGEHPVAVPVEA